MNASDNLMKNKNLILFVSGISISLLVGCGGGTGGSDDTSGGGPTEVAAGMVRFQPDFPPEQIEGTPVEGDLSNVEPVPGRPPSLSMPSGVQLISGRKPVTSSDDMPIIGDLSYITDGEKLAGEGYYVELMPGPQWVQIDLEEPKEIFGIWLWHYHLQARAYQSVVVQISNDENFATGVTTVFNNDYANAWGFGRGRERPYLESRYGKPIQVNGVSGRYVRLHANGNTANDMNHFIEVEVYGR
jgi:hypothetical protein